MRPGVSARVSQLPIGVHVEAVLALPESPDVAADEDPEAGLRLEQEGGPADAGVIVTGGDEVYNRQTGLEGIVMSAS